MNTLNIKETKSFNITEELPTGVDIVKKGIIKDGRFFAILGKGDSYTQDKVYISISNTQLEEVEVISVNRLRDGGTTIYTTKAGEFYFPSPLSKKKFDVPTFNKEPIELL
jgi:hypothetical protein